MTRHIRNSPFAPVEVLIHRETMDEFLARGGTIQRCPPRVAHSELEGTIRVDGATYTAIPGGTEAIPQMNRISVESYDRGVAEAIQPPQYLSWNDIARESVSGELRQRMDYRQADADELDYTENGYG